MTEQNTVSGGGTAVADRPPFENKVQQITAHVALTKLPETPARNREIHAVLNTPVLSEQARRSPSARAKEFLTLMKSRASEHMVGLATSATTGAATALFTEAALATNNLGVKAVALTAAGVTTLAEGAHLNEVRESRGGTSLKAAFTRAREGAKSFVGKADRAIRQRAHKGTTLKPVRP